MALQSYVNKEYALGVPGDMVNPGEGQNVFTPVNPKADGDVNVGSFVFPGSDPYTMASNAAAVDTAGADTYAVAATPSSGSAVSGNITVVNNGADISLASTVGAANKTASTNTSASGTLTIPVGKDFDGTVTLGGKTIATVASGGTVTPGSTLTATGTNSTVTVSQTTYSGTDIVITFSVEWTATGTGAAVMGFVVRVQMYPNYILTSSGTLTVPSGCALSVAVRGDFYANSKTEATIGQKVFASTTDGSISTGAAGSSVSGSVETDFVVKRGGAAGDLIVIGNQ